MRNAASKARQVGMTRAFAAAVAVLVAVALLMTMASATLAVTTPAAPVIVSPPEGSYDNDGAFTLSGTAPTNSDVKVFEEASGNWFYRGTARVSATGQWALPLSGVADGTHAYKARVTDLASSLSSNDSNTRTVIVDTKAPAAPSLDVSDDGKLIGTAEANSTVELFQNGTSLGTVQADSYWVNLNGTGRFSKQVLLSLKNEHYLFEVRATDRAGNVSGWSNKIQIDVACISVECAPPDGSWSRGSGTDYS